MEVTGTVTKTVKRTASYGSVYMSVTLRTDAGSDVTLKYLSSPATRPVKGERVTVEGMPMMLSPQRGRPVTPNIGGVSLTRLEAAR
jgi:hypothetical protein